VKRDRHHARILAMQALCQLDVQGDDALGLFDKLLGESGASPATAEYARRLACSCWEQRRELDRRLAAQLERWDVERLSPVERNVIRVAMVELPGGDVPPKVVINEAVEIGREFGGLDSPKFINGILDALWKQNGTV
jgi:N utilization substance protein B